MRSAATSPNFNRFERAVASALETYGRIDILHNNVGAVVHGGPIELDEISFQRNIDLNLGSIYRTSKVVLPHFLAQRKGVIVNISSLAATRWTGYPYFAYYASKAAVNQATVALAVQYAPRWHQSQCHPARVCRHTADLQADFVAVCVR